MNPLNSRQIRGNWATLLLPINEDQSIDFGRLADEIDFLIACHPDGIYSNGTAGEFYAQTEDEFDRISALLAQRCEAAGVPFQIGASSANPAMAVSRIRRAAALRPSAIQVILSDWFPLGDAEVIDCLSGYCDAANGIGLVLYNPPHAKRVLRPREFLPLTERAPGLVGIKVADGDDAWYTAMRPVMERLSVFVPGHHLATGYSHGAAGAYSNVACLNPRGAQLWYDRMTTDLPGALDIERRLREFFDRHVMPIASKDGYCNAALDKLLAAIGAWGHVGTRLRWPYRWVPPEIADALRPVVRRMAPELFPSM
jgi:4-hydroxy-tetrahydrodipicolinate synthase